MSTLEVSTPSDQVEPGTQVDAERTDISFTAEYSEKLLLTCSRCASATPRFTKMPLEPSDTACDAAHCHLRRRFMILLNGLVSLAHGGYEIRPA